MTQDQNAAWIGELTAAQRDTAFGAGEGRLGFSVLRIPVGQNQSDWSRDLATAKREVALGATVMSHPILNDAAALANVDIIGAHLYGTPYANFPYPLFKQKGAGRELWMNVAPQGALSMSNGSLTVTLPARSAMTFATSV